MMSALMNIVKRMFAACCSTHTRLPYVSTLLLLCTCIVTITSQNYDDNRHFENNQRVYQDSADYPINSDISPDYVAGQNDPLDRSPWPANKPQFDVDSEISKLNFTPIWTPRWPDPSVGLGQMSAVSINVYGQVVVFHRANKIWESRTFTFDNRYWNVHEAPIPLPTIAVFNSSSGLIVDQWGQNMFYMPHGLTVDSNNNIWVTDVALHQVMKFNSGEKSIPSLTLGVRFEPGNDNHHFCKPTSVAVMTSGDFFVSDGYCNSQIIKYTATGQRIAQWGIRTFHGIAQSVPSPYSFAVPHALILAEDKGLLCTADRENGRVLCFQSSNGTFVTQFHSQVIGARLFSIAYSPLKGGRLYVVNGPEYSPHPIRGFVIDMTSRSIISQFRPKNMDFATPHDIAISKDGKEIYVVELDPHKIHKFVDPTIETVKIKEVKKSDSKAIENETTNKSSAHNITVPIPVKPTATVEGLSLVGNSWGGWAGVAGGVAGGLGAVLLLLLGGAALLLRARHRGGCLSPLTPRNRRQRWDYAPGAPDFKLRHLLERPRGAGFERINTEESDEEPTPATSMLAPQNA